MRNSRTGSSVTPPVTAAQPIIGGSAPAAPPMTMFCGVAPLQPHRVDDDVEEDGEGEQRGGERSSPEARASAPTRPASVRPKASASPGAIRPAGIGRGRCAPCSASMSASYHMLSAPAAPAPTAMQSSAVSRDHRMQMPRRDHQADKRREDHERHHARLQQREVVADASRGGVGSARSAQASAAHVCRSGREVSASSATSVRAGLSGGRLP